MLHKDRIRKETRYLRELLKLIHSQIEEPPEAMVEDLKWTIQTLRWALHVGTDRDPGAPSFWLGTKVRDWIQEEDSMSPAVQAFVDRMFEEDGRWPLERN